ncbi:hypothetical protein Micbo1qcDRAFT_171819 [Microdochium bolleyi]|uniref:Uncharacterized protein n=1 Tax=Microdochium bolleyi TaxID=196109 RepID=A0A136JGP0_9PEZI|nr:hypothetical protein Micbo1qcDRAFT_171819 [Microdochium bolleyi]
MTTDDVGKVRPRPTEYGGARGGEAGARLAGPSEDKMRLGGGRSHLRSTPTSEVLHYTAASCPSPAAIPAPLRITDHGSRITTRRPACTLEKANTATVPGTRLGRTMAPAEHGLLVSSASSAPSESAQPRANNNTKVSLSDDASDATSKGFVGQSPDHRHGAARGPGREASGSRMQHHPTITLRR